MPHVMESDWGQAVVLEELSERRGKPARPDDIAVLEDVDVVVEVVVVARPEDFLEPFLAEASPLSYRLVSAS